MARREPLRRSRLVLDLERQGIHDTRVLAALRDIPRERFVEEALRGEAYSDRALPIGEKQTISQPWIVARMTELLNPDSKARVLEVGTGSGYHAAVLSRVFAVVYTVERHRKLAQRARHTLRELSIENVHFKIFDGSYGWSEFAPYGAILVTAAVPEPPMPLVEQLRVGGHLVLPIGDRHEQTLTRIVNTGDGIEREQHGPCRFVPLIGKYGWDGP